MIEAIINDIGVINIATIAASVLLAFIVLFFVCRNREQKKRAAQAAKIAQLAQAAIVFRNKVLGELEGLYPVHQYWAPELLGKFRGVIPQIESAAAEFRPFVTVESRKSFDNALKKYCTHCKGITLADCIASNLSPGKGKPEEVEAKEAFRENVIELMSFTKASRAQ
jgi:hypothetical protein